MTHPLLYEINARGWLRELSERAGRNIDLKTVPEEEFRLWRRLGFTHVWLMGVWTTGPRSRRHALAQPALRKKYGEVLPDWQPRDVLGSPYAVGEYRVPDFLGGMAGLKAFRQRLHERGLRLILDFVPNHLGLDHAWLSERPELFVRSSGKAPNTLRRKTSRGVQWFAHGRDPYFPAWTDTAQLDYRRRETRLAMLRLLRNAAQSCDGVRCDMAMLLLNDVFHKTWLEFPCSRHGPEEEFWSEAICSVKASRPDFLFLAEVYWGLERRLQGLGFDYTYDKELYDHLVSRQPGSVQAHLLHRSPEFLRASTHFLENHDEPRIAALLSPAEHRAAALLTLVLPGMRMLHEGQLTGARLHTPVQLGRRSAEMPQAEIADFYEELLGLLSATAVGQGEAEVLAPTQAWEKNPTAGNIVVVQWATSPAVLELAVVNLAAHRSQCYVRLQGALLATRNWQMKDLLGHERYERRGAELAAKGLYLDLPAHAAQWFQLRPLF